MSQADYPAGKPLSNNSEAPGQDPNYVTCPICGKHVGQLGGHLADRHPEMPITEFHEKYPNTPMTSIAVLERKRAANKQRWANASPKERQRHGKAIKKAVAAPEVREKHSASMKLAQSDPQKKKRILDGVQKALTDPEKVKRRIEALKKALAKPSVRRRFSAARKRDWENPAYRQKVTAARSRLFRELWALKSHLHGTQTNGRGQAMEVRKGKKTGPKTGEKLGPIIDRLEKQGLKWDAIKMHLDAETRVYRSVDAYQGLLKRYRARKAQQSVSRKQTVELNSTEKPSN